MKPHVNSKLCSSQYIALDVDSARFSSPLEDVVVNSTPLKGANFCAYLWTLHVSDTRAKKAIQPSCLLHTPPMSPSTPEGLLLIVSAPPGDHLITYLDNIQTFSPFQNLELEEWADTLQISSNFSCSLAQLIYIVWRLIGLSLPDCFSVYETVGTEFMSKIYCFEEYIAVVFFLIVSSTF
jgi:hypothetical protein